MTKHLNPRGLRRAGDLLDAHPAAPIPALVPSIEELAAGRPFVTADQATMDRLAIIGERARPACRRVA